MTKDDFYFYTYDGTHIMCSVLTPEMMLGDVPLFDTEAKCRAYYAQESGANREEAA